MVSFDLSRRGRLLLRLLRLLLGQLVNFPLQRVLLAHNITAHDFKLFNLLVRSSF